MKKRSLAVAGGLFLLAGLAATPAYADCAEDIKELEQRLSLLQQTTRGTNKDNAERLMAEAKQALADGKKKMCAKKVKAANRQADKIQ